MNEKVVGLLAIGVILWSTAWLHKSGVLTDRAEQGLVIVLLAAGVGLRAVAVRLCRRAVIMRRRFYKEFWRRAKAYPNCDFKEEEENAVVLLGRIKGARWTTASMTVVSSVALLCNATFLALVMAVGQIYLAGQLQYFGRSTDRSIPSDGDRPLPDVRIPNSSSDEYVVRIDVGRVHDFIEPPLALPFWRVVEAERWLGRCGFARINEHEWKTNRSALRYLDADEILSIAPCH